MQRNISIGKYTLESLTAGMYSSPKDLLREYIQNCVDSIDQAIEAEVISKNAAKILISIDKENRRITIEDNGLGLNADVAINRLTDIGNSNKTYSSSRGFRGIGRLAGLSYCEKLTFETSCKGEDLKTVLTFDCLRLKELLIPGKFSEYDLSGVLAEVTSYEMLSESSKNHYFKVILENVEEIDGILSIDEVKDYLSQVAPLPFDKNKFKLVKRIKGQFKTKNVEIDEYNIFVGSGEEYEQIYKVYSDIFVADKLKKLSDEINDIKVVEVLDERGNVQAIMWYAISNFYGTVLDESRKGIRFRKGNILIGDKSTLNSIFKEDRFNGWYQGEIYVLDDGIIPNARRDNFEKNLAFLELLKRLTIIGDELSKSIRNISNERSKNNLNIDNVDETDISNSMINAEIQIGSIKSDVFKQLSLLANNISGQTKYKILNLSPKLNIEQKKTLEKVYDVITEQMENKKADYIITEIMKKF
jgi:hypothetical protein